MGKETKPNSRIIQITSIIHKKYAIIDALCEDGSIWRYDYIEEYSVKRVFEGGRYEWNCILEAGYYKKEPSALDEFLKQNHFKPDGIKIEFLNE